MHACTPCAILVHCKISNKPDYYESYNSSLQEGSAVITFKCDYGFFVIGEVISICINSEQRTAIPTCTEGINYNAEDPMFVKNSEFSCGLDYAISHACLLFIVID